jgi:hypothetical protein
MINVSDSDDEFSDKSSQEGESTLDLLVESIHDPINRLYRTSIWIRNPSSRFASSKALRHQQIDEDTGLDLLTAYGPFDRDFVSSLFSHWKPTAESSVQRDPIHHTRKGKEKVATDDGMPFVHPADYLIQRLTRANYRRRQQFSYWKRHREKAHLHAKSSAPAILPAASTLDQHVTSSEMKGPLAHSVTTATLLKSQHIPSFRDDITVGSLSIYAPSYRSGTAEQISFPAPPKVAPNQKYFECPYCFTICPSKMSKPEAWR